MLGYLVLIMLFAFLVTEGFVEYFLGQLFQRVAKLSPYQWALMYVSALAGVGLCLYYKIDLVSLLSDYTKMPEVIAPGPVGELLTGLAVGRGANFVHDLIDKFFPSADK